MGFKCTYFKEANICKSQRVYSLNLAQFKSKGFELLSHLFLMAVCDYCKDQSVILSSDSFLNVLQNYASLI